MFKAPRSGDFSAAHVFRYRALAAGPDDRVLARYDDGGDCGGGAKSRAGRVIVWTSTLDDSWTDIARQAGIPAARPPARAVSRATTKPPTSWFTVGQVLDLSARMRSRAARDRRRRPSGERMPQTGAGEGAEGLLELNEQGVYEVRLDRQRRPGGPKRSP